MLLARILRTIEFSEDKDTLSLTERDHLTGLYDRDFFYRHAIQLDAHHKDFPTDAIVIDIKHIHVLNERFGKTYGDEVLRCLANRLLSRLEKEGGFLRSSSVFSPHIHYLMCRRNISHV